MAAYHSAKGNSLVGPVSSSVWRWGAAIGVGFLEARAKLYVLRDGG